MGWEGPALGWWWRKNKGGNPDAHRVVVRAPRSFWTPSRRQVPQYLLYGPSHRVNEYFQCRASTYRR